LYHISKRLFFSIHILEYFQIRFKIHRDVGVGDTLYTNFMFWMTVHKQICVVSDGAKANFITVDNGAEFKSALWTTAQAPPKMFP
jgi:hypothetical protein